MPGRSVLHGRRVLLGVTGSIAAYKSAVLARELMRRGAEVRVVLTAAAQEFVAPLTFATLTGHRVYSDFTEDRNQGTWTNHVDLGLWGDVMLVAPATAETCAAFAAGSCSNFLQAVFLSSRCPVAVAPAMDLDMFAHPATTANLACLRERGIQVFEPESGPLASGLEGKGRMVEPEALADALEDWIAASLPLRGVRALVTVGPTHEPIDAVRFLGNRSSGKMGFAVCEALRDAGAEVTAVCGPVSVPVPPGLTEVVHVETAVQMQEAVAQRALHAGLFIGVAAVADVRPAVTVDRKLRRNELPTRLELVPNPDILAGVAHSRRPGQCIGGFALDSGRNLEMGWEKLRGKGLDFIVYNTTADDGGAFGADAGELTLLTRDGNSHTFEMQAKRDAAYALIRHLIPLCTTP